MGEQVVLDSSNLAAVIADATGEPPEPTPVAEAPKEAPKEAVKEVPKETPKGEDDGLTDEERKSLTHKMQVAIGKRHRQMREAQEQALKDRAARQEAEARAERAEKEIERARAAVPAPKPENTKPDPANFASADAYQEALVDWKVEQKLTAAREEESARRQKEEQDRVIGRARERIAKAMELVPDFQEVTESVDLPVPPHIAGYMQESDLFAELGYFFAKNPKELERLGGLSPARSLVEIGKIESKLSPFGSSEPKADGVPPSTDTGDSPSRPRVHAPVIRPLSTRGAIAESKPDSEMTPREAVAAFQRRTGANLTRRSRH